MARMDRSSGAEDVPAPRTNPRGRLCGQRLIGTASCVCLALMAACEGPTASRSGPPATIEVVSGDSQLGTPFATLARPLAVRVLDGKGAPVVGEPVTFTPRPPDRVDAPQDTTDQDGRAQVRLTVGTVDGQRQVDVRAGTALATMVFRVPAESIAATSVGVPTTGGTIVLPLPGAPQDTAQVIVSPGTFAAATQVSLFLSTVPGGGLSPEVEPLAPLITIDVGGLTADSLVRVRVTIGDHATSGVSVYRIDLGSGALRPVPVVALDASSVTFVVRRSLSPPATGSTTARRSSRVSAAASSSSFLVKETTSGSGVLSTGFQPGADDFEFANYGSAIAPDGFCLGQSLATIWYYLERRLSGAPALHNRYSVMAAPAIMDYDNRAFRLASVVQEDNSGIFSVLQQYLATSTDDEAWNQLVDALATTSHPVELGVSGRDGGHSLIVWKIDQASGTIWIADPCHPGDMTRTISYDTGRKRFGTYSGCLKADGTLHTFGTIRFTAAEAYDWTAVGQRWQQFDNGTIGSTGSNSFPAVTVSASADGSAAVPIGQLTSTDAVSLSLQANPGFYPFVVSSSGALVATASSAAPSATVPLRSGANSFGVLVVDANNKAVDFTILSVTATRLPFLRFVAQPQDGLAGTPLPGSVSVEVVDLDGSRVTSPQTSIALALGANPTGAVLTGPSSASTVDGVATFTGITVDRSGLGFTLSALAPSRDPGQSTAFNVASSQLGIQQTGLVLAVGDSALLEPWFVSPPPASLAVGWSTSNAAILPLRQQTPDWNAFAYAQAPGTVLVAIQAGQEWGFQRITVVEPVQVGTPTLLNPPYGATLTNFPRDMTLAWTGVPGVTLYDVDMEGCSGFHWQSNDAPYGCSDWFNALFVGHYVGVRGTSFPWSFVGAQPGRWRIRAIDANGNPGSFSGWFYFRFVY